MITTTTGWPPPPVRTPRWRGGPPGVLFYLAAGAAILIAVDASSRDSLWMSAVGAVVWVVIALVWLVRFALDASRSRLHIPIAHWGRWMVIPAAMGLVFVVGLSGALFDARFDLSRGALDQMAAEVMAGGQTQRGWVGLYGVGDVERLEGGLRFVVDDSGLYRLGLAYSPNGEPAQSTVEDYGLWTGAWFEPLGGGWWLWTEEWD